MKWLMRIAMVLGIVVILALVVVVFGINHLAKSGIEQGATYALGVDTQLNDANVGMFNGQFAMSGLQVDNPENFTSPFFLQLGKGEVAVSLGSLMEDEVVLPLLALKGVEIYLEYDGDKGNYEVILDNLQSLKSPADPDAPSGADAPSAPADDAEGKKFIVDEILIKDVTVHASVKIAGDEPTGIDLTIPEIKLKQIGSRSGGGVVLSQLSGVLIKVILEEAFKQGDKLLPQVILGGLDGGLKQVDALTQDVQVEAQKAIEQVTKSVEDVTKEVQEVGKQLDSLFDGLGGKKKDEP